MANNGSYYLEQSIQEPKSDVFLNTYKFQLFIFTKPFSENSTKQCEFKYFLRSSVCNLE